MKQLRESIREKGIKMNWIADKIGVSQPLLSMYLSGERLMPEEKERAIKALLN